MGVRLIVDREQEIVAMYCSTSDWAFGPLFHSEEQALDFLAWLETDPRRLSDHELESRKIIWHTLTHTNDNDEEGRFVKGISKNWCIVCGSFEERIEWHNKVMHSEENENENESDELRSRNPSKEES